MSDYESDYEKNSNGDKDSYAGDSQHNVNKSTSNDVNTTPSSHDDGRKKSSVSSGPAADAAAAAPRALDGDGYADDAFDNDDDEEPTAAAAPPPQSSVAPAPAAANKKSWNDADGDGYSDDAYDSEADEAEKHIAAPQNKNNNNNTANTNNATHNGTMQLRLKAGAFTAKGLPSQNVKGTRFPMNIYAVARVRPFSEKELSPAAAPSVHNSGGGKTDKKSDASTANKNGKPKKDSIVPPAAAANPAIPFRARRVLPVVDSNPPQSLIRIGVPEQGIFQNFALDGVAWGLKTAAHQEPLLESNGSSSSNAKKKNSSNLQHQQQEEGHEQAMTWRSVGERLVDSIIKPMPGSWSPSAAASSNNTGGAASSSSSTTAAGVYGNSCLVSYGASNSGKSFALFGAINPSAPPPAPPAATKNAAVVAMGNTALGDVKAKEEAFYYANKNRAKRDQLMNAGPSSSSEKKRSTSNGAAAQPKNDIKPAKEVLSAAEVNTVVPSDGLIVRAADALLKQLVVPSSSVPHPTADLHMACLRLHNERLTDLCDLEDPHETRHITTQLYYPDTGDKTVTEGSLHYYGLKGVRPTKVSGIADVKEMIVRARQQIQRAPAGYLAGDVVPSLKGKPDQHDVVVKAKAAKEKEREERDPNAAAERRRKEEEAALAKANNSASAVHGSTMVILLYVVPKKDANGETAAAAAGSGANGSSSSSTALLPPRTALQKLIFVDLPDSNAISKGVSTTSVNAGKEIAFTNGESAETPLQIANDKAITSMLLALGSSLADSVRYGRGKFPQHQYLFDRHCGGKGSTTIEDLLGATAAGARHHTSADAANNHAQIVKFSTTGPTHYRNSLLTRVLKEASYGPNTFTAVLGCVSPLASDVTASLSTLRFLQAIKAQPVTTVGWNEMELLRNNSSSSSSSSPPEMEFTKTAIIGSLAEPSCEAFDLAVERRAAEKAKVNPYTMLRLGGTISSGAAASLAPQNAKKEENDFFKSEAAARNDLFILFQTELTAMQKVGFAERFAMAKKANQSRKLQAAIANGNAAIGVSATERSKLLMENSVDGNPANATLSNGLEDDFESQFRAPHKITTSTAATSRAHINNDTSAFLREHHKKYRFKEEPKGSAHVSTNTLGLSNQTLSNQRKIEEDKKKIAAGELKAATKKTGPPRIPNKKKPEPPVEEPPAVERPKKVGPSAFAAAAKAGEPVSYTAPGVPPVKRKTAAATDASAAPPAAAAAGKPKQPQKPVGKGPANASPHKPKAPPAATAAAPPSAAIAPKAPSSPPRSAASPRNTNHSRASADSSDDEPLTKADANTANIAAATAADNDNDAEDKQSAASYASASSAAPSAHSSRRASSVGAGGGAQQQRQKSVSHGDDTHTQHDDADKHAAAPTPRNSRPQSGKASSAAAAPASHQQSAASSRKPSEAKAPSVDTEHRRRSAEAEGDEVADVPEEEEAVAASTEPPAEEVDEAKEDAAEKNGDGDVVEEEDGVVEKAPSRKPSPPPRGDGHEEEEVVDEEEL